MKVRDSYLIRSKTNPDHFIHLQEGYYIFKPGFGSAYVLELREWTEIIESKQFIGYLNETQQGFEMISMWQAIKQSLELECKKLRNC